MAAMYVVAKQHLPYKTHLGFVEEAVLDPAVDMSLLFAVKDPDCEMLGPNAPVPYLPPPPKVLVPGGGEVGSCHETLDDVERLNEELAAYLEERRRLAAEFKTRRGAAAERLQETLIDMDSV
ncbi:hypothetical protein QBC39DRAFT_375116 [Podospora conica]|nr:hypothetical protein QBC39DRAFT_375116 [Schizothecium conicum]